MYNGGKDNAGGGCTILGPEIDQQDIPDNLKTTHQPLAIYLITPSLLNPLRNLRTKQNNSAILL